MINRTKTSEIGRKKSDFNLILTSSGLILD